MVQMLLPIKKRRGVLEPASSDRFRETERRAAERSSSSNVYVDIPKELLVEILCRLPSPEFVCRCKLVSRTWCALISDPYFIGRFLWIQREKQTAVLGSIINEYEDELIHDTKQVNPGMKILFKNLVKRVPQVLVPPVLATWNDLVLCSTDHEDRCEYHIGNPRTMQLVSLPPTHRYRREPVVGIICEPVVGFICEPYYEEQEDSSIVIAESDRQETEERKVIKTNSKYKFKVVRIICPDDWGKPCFEFNIQVFSSETGEWRNSIASCPQGFCFSRLLHPQSVASSGMLYWNASDGGILGLGPLMVNNKRSTTAANGDNSSYQFHVIEFDQLDNPYPHYAVPRFRLQLHRGCLQMVYETCYAFLDDSARLLLWELKEEELKQMAVQGGGKLGRKHRRTYNMLDLEVPEVIYECLDPSDIDACIVRLQTGTERYNVFRYYKCNIHTGKKQTMMKDKLFGGWKKLQFRFTWWPTPLPVISANEEQV